MYDWIYIYEFEGNVSSGISAIKGDDDYIGFWKEGNFSFLFFKKEKKELLRKIFLTYRSELVIRHEDWESGSSLDILSVGRFMIHPPWKAPPQDGKVHLCIDPNMAFGSGYHSSTKGCLTLLDILFQHDIPERVLDLGTGTGILSIACLKMDTNVTFSLDYNNLSIHTAQKNRSLNGLEDRMHLWLGDARDSLHVPADLAIANMHFQVIDQITSQEAFYSKKYYLISGLLGHEGHRIQEKLKERLTLLDSCQENFWFSFLFANPTHGPSSPRHGKIIY